MSTAADPARQSRSRPSRSPTIDRPPRLVGRLGLVMMTVILAVTLEGRSAIPVGAAADVGGGFISGENRDSVRAARPGDGSSEARPRYSAPVDTPVVDPFRAPAGPYGPGNRGLDYRTRPGSVVGSIGAGTVAFAGQVAGRLVISIDHPDGLRSSLVGLAVIDTVVGRRVARGDAVGRAGPMLHLGVRRDGVYLDPATLFAGPGPARLVPWPGSADLASGFRLGRGRH